MTSLAMSRHLALRLLRWSASLVAVASMLWIALTAVHLQQTRHTGVVESLGLAAFTAAFIVVHTVFPDVDVNLGNGYRYLQVDGADYVIAAPPGRVGVGRDVVRYRKIGAYVVGERQNPACCFDADVESTVFGFFLLDTMNGELVDGLDQANLYIALSARNLDPVAF
jgi:hypothetical protein